MELLSPAFLLGVALAILSVAGTCWLVAMTSANGTPPSTRRRHFSKDSETPGEYRRAFLVQLTVGAKG